MGPFDYFYTRKSQLNPYYDPNADPATQDVLKRPGLIQYIVSPETARAQAKLNTAYQLDALSRKQQQREQLAFIPELAGAQENTRVSQFAKQFASLPDEIKKPYADAFQAYTMTGGNPTASNMFGTRRAVAQLGAGIPESEAIFDASNLQERIAESRQNLFNKIPEISSNTRLSQLKAGDEAAQLGLETSSYERKLLPDTFNLRRTNLANDQRVASNVIPIETDVRLGNATAARANQPTEQQIMQDRLAVAAGLAGTDVQDMNLLTAGQHNKNIGSTIASRFLDMPASSRDATVMQIDPAAQSASPVQNPIYDDPMAAFAALSSPHVALGEQMFPRKSIEAIPSRKPAPPPSKPSAGYKTIFDKTLGGLEEPVTQNTPTYKEELLQSLGAYLTPDGRWAIKPKEATYKTEFGAPTVPQIATTTTRNQPAYSPEEQAKLQRLITAILSDNKIPWKSQPK